MSRKVFLTARWENLIIISYKVKPEILEPYMPRGLEADTIDGNAFVSLVAFSFLETKVKGIKIPFHVNFPEINIRFYVKNNEKRGVVFIREFVPKSLIAYFANLLYNENYKSISMKNYSEKNGKVFLNHTIRLNGKEYQINIEAENKPYFPPVNSTEHFFKEHEWGFGIARKGEPMIYRVEHPFWEIYPVIKYENNFDFGEIYSRKWEFLNKENPYNITLARGSAVKVYDGEVLK